jgi:hypothetical protein
MIARVRREGRKCLHRNRWLTGSTSRPKVYCSHICLCRYLQNWTAAQIHTQRTHTPFARFRKSPPKRHLQELIIHFRQNKSTTTYRSKQEDWTIKHLTREWNKWGIWTIVHLISSRSSSSSSGHKAFETKNGFMQRFICSFEYKTLSQESKMQWRNCEERTWICNKNLHRMHKVSS